MITACVEFHGVNAYVLSRDNKMSCKHCDCKYVKQQPLYKGWGGKMQTNTILFAWSDFGHLLKASLLASQFTCMF